MKRPKKLLHPPVLVIHDFWFAARSRCSVKPTVRRARGLEPGSASLIMASVFSFLSAVAFTAGFSRGPNNFSLSPIFIYVFTG